MILAVPLIVVTAALLALLGTRLAAGFGYFVGWAMAFFPYGMIGMVALGVLLVVLLTERERT